MSDWLDEINWPDGDNPLLPAVAQDAASGEILMVAYMNRESLAKTLEIGEAVYWSRSRGLWHKGHSSGHWQRLQEIRIDCDADVILLKVEQVGGIACHTGRRSCFFKVLRDGEWVVDAPVLKEPGEIYGD